MEFVIANGDEAPRGWVTVCIPSFADQFIEEPGEQQKKDNDETRWKPIVPPLKPGASFREQMRILGKTVAKEAHARRSQAAAASAFQLYTLTHEGMRLRMTRQNAAIYKSMAKELVKIVPPDQLPMPAEKFVCVLDAIITGLLFTFFQTPELITDDVFVAAFEALA